METPPSPSTPHTSISSPPHTSTTPSLQHRGIRNHGNAKASQETPPLRLDEEVLPLPDNATEEMELRTGGMECGLSEMEFVRPVVEQGAEEDSNSSWVAEDASDELEDETCQTGLTGSVLIVPSRFHTAPPRPHPVPLLGPLKTTFSPSFAAHPPPSFRPPSLHTRPLSTSTPQLSPVNEEGHPHSGEALEGVRDYTYPLQRPGHQPHPPQRAAVDGLHSIPEQSLFHTTPTFKTPSSK